MAGVMAPGKPSAKQSALIKVDSSYSLADGKMATTNLIEKNLQPEKKKRQRKKNLESEVNTVLAKKMKQIDNSKDMEQSSRRGGMEKEELAGDVDNSLTSEDFLKVQKDLNITVGAGEQVVGLVARKKEMSTGSFGWTATSNAVLPYGQNDDSVKVTITINIVVGGSKLKPDVENDTKATTPQAQAVSGRPTRRERKRKAQEKADQ
ncbi:hypothetical protein CI109_106363 [Kwoniella shandongensis]|uniref:Uncharacterized protein n=1 Tax=Kwoniella shandongensis TaxID=1734106 RepID=A0A5M6BXN5_9TREE|nr:uncharacterized protein CI109_005932 [Kwoniella shandongensis]KAA5525769.1 hypothetical protein CI109_005932 [Kwoniella shandongensis]